MTKIDCYGSELVEATRQICQIAGQVGMNPMLTECLLTADPETGELSIYATDLTMCYERRIGVDFLDDAEQPVESPSKGFTVVVSAKQLLKIAVLFEKLQSVRVWTLAGNWLCVEGVLSDGRRSTHKIVGLPAEEFPPFPLFGAELVADRTKQIAKLDALMAEPFKFEQPDEATCLREYEKTRDDPFTGLRQKAKTLRASVEYWREHVES